MKIKVTDSVLCIPPYISVHWDQVIFLQTEPDAESGEPLLFIHLANGKIIEIPHLDAGVVDILFSTHFKHLEKKNPPPKKESNNNVANTLQSLLGISPDSSTSIPLFFRMSSGNGDNLSMPSFENMDSAFQHNQEKASLPDMPKDVIEKLTQIAALFAGGDISGFPKPEPHCNCMHCQIARAIHQIPKAESISQEVNQEEMIQEEDLRFKSWDITQSHDSEKLYIVTHPLDTQEQYNVYLGSPVGCTCGEAHCEHIRAVLNS